MNFKRKAEIMAKKKLTAKEIEQQIKQLQDQLEELRNTKPDFEHMKAGDEFTYCGLTWVCLDPGYCEESANEFGCLAIVKEFWRSDVLFDYDESNNYFESDIRELLKKELELKLEYKTIPHLIDTVMENGKEQQPGKTVSDHAFLLSIQEYIRYAEHVPYSNYDDWFWLRSPYPSHALIVRYVSTDGSLTSSIAVDAGGVAPACIFKI